MKARMKLNLKNGDHFFLEGDIPFVEPPDTGTRVRFQVDIKLKRYVWLEVVECWFDYNRGWVVDLDSETEHRETLQILERFRDNKLDGWTPGPEWFEESNFAKGAYGVHEADIPGYLAKWRKDTEAD